jgi:hypothetical protein
MVGGLQVFHSITMKPPFLLSFGLFLTAPLLQAASFSVSGTTTETVGSTAEISDSGSKSNTTVWSPGTVGEFTVTDGLGNQYGLRVDALNPTGVLAAGTDSLMVTRTVNSQGLTDTGTVSIYVNPGNTSPASGTWTLDLRFSFFDTTFTTPTDVDLMLTSLDIDFGQKYFTSNTDFQSTLLYGNSALVADSSAPGYSGLTATGGSSFSDPAHAVSSIGSGTSTYNVRVGHDSVALFMFEFRDPSSIIPEPSSALAAALGFGAVLLRRRRL